MPGGHHPCGTVQHRAEVIVIPQLGFSGRNPHPNRQLQLALRVDGGLNCGHRRGKRGSHAVPRVAENEPIVRLDGGAQHLVMR